MTFQTDYNPFATVDFAASAGLHDFISSFSKTQGGDISGVGALGIAPFRRMIDGWLLAAAVAVAKDVPIVSADRIPGDKFVTGVVLQREIETIEFMMLLAIAITGNPYIVDEPKEIVKCLRERAEAGYPYLDEMLREGNQPNLYTLVKNLVSTLSGSEGPAGQN